MTQSHLNQPSGQDVAVHRVRQRTASGSSGSSSVGQVQEALNSSWDTDIHSQLQNALSELTDLCGSPSPRSEAPDQTDSADSGVCTIVVSPKVASQGHEQSGGQGQGRTGLRIQTSFSGGAKPVISTKPKVTSPKPVVLPKPAKQVVVLPPDPKPTNGVQHPGLLERLESQSQDLTPEGADTDSAFSDTASLPSSGSHVSVTTSHHSGCSQGSGGSGGSEGSSGLGTSAGSGTVSTFIFLGVLEPEKTVNG